MLRSEPAQPSLTSAAPASPDAPARVGKQTRVEHPAAPGLAAPAVTPDEAAANLAQPGSHDLHALRQLLGRALDFPLDPTIADRMWGSAARIREALHAGRMHTRLLAQAGAARTGAVHRHRDRGHWVYAEDLNEGMSVERVLLRLVDMRGVLGVAVEPRGLAEQLHHPGVIAPSDLAAIAAMGFHTLRLGVEAPSTDAQLAPLAPFFRALVDHNRAHPRAPLRVILMVGLRGGVTGPRTALDIAELHDDPEITAKRLAYLRYLANRILAKLGDAAMVDGVPALCQPVFSATAATAQLTDDIVRCAVDVLGGTAAAYRLQLEGVADRKPDAVGRAGARFGEDAAGVVGQLTRTYGIGAYVAGVELGNEPEAQWKTPGVHFDEVGRDEAFGHAAVDAFAARRPGVAAMEAAREWDPASEQNLIYEVYNLVRDRRLDPVAVRDLVRASRWGHALDALAHGRRGATTPVPVAIHVYNSAMLARALIATLAEIAAHHHLQFAVSITEAQIDGRTYDHPSPDRLAEAEVELGAAIMDEAARYPHVLRIVQLVLFSYHHVANRPGQDFGLRGNRTLRALTGA
jgi:hypothetical protein